MTKRDILISLNSPTAFFDGVKQALGANGVRYRVRRILIATELHRILCGARGKPAQEIDPELKFLFTVYDSESFAGLKHGDVGGCIYGAVVFLDDKLAGRTLIVETEPAE